jgi:hypothetical protein
MNRKENAFRKSIKKLLDMTGTSFRGIELACRRCKQQAFARDLSIAAGLGGWTSIRRVRGPHYSGLCMDCSPQPKRQRSTR